MIHGIGVDILAAQRMQQILWADGLAHFDRVFTPAEIAAAREHPNQIMYWASRFAAKEAVFKCLRTDVAFRLDQIEIRSDAAGRPYAVLSGEALDIANAEGIVRIDLSISYDQGYAAAFAVASRE